MRSSKIIFTLTLAGLLFSGYLSAVKLLTNTCAFGETCPLFLGYPACWYGFCMYLIMFVVSTLGVMGKTRIMTVFKIDAFVSFVGILFAGNLVLREMQNASITGELGLSTCAYGLIFYILIFSVSLRAFRMNRGY